MENVLIASEKAYSNRPILKSHLGYEIIKGLKKHGATTNLIDGIDESELRYDKLLAAAVVFSKEIGKWTSKKRVGIILPPGKAGLLSNLAVLFAGKVPVNLNFTAGEAAINSCIEQADMDKFITAGPFIDKMDTFAWPDREKLILVDEVLPPLKLKIAVTLVLNKFQSADALAKSLGIPKEGGHDEAILLFTAAVPEHPRAWFYPTETFWRTSISSVPGSISALTILCSVACHFPQFRLYGNYVVSADRRSQSHHLPEPARYGSAH